MDHHHFLLVSFSFQSHINPVLRLATKLTRAGARVSFATTVNGLNKLKTRPSLPGLSYDSFSDGHDADDGATIPGYFQQIELIGSINLKNLLLTKVKHGQKVDFLIYGMCLPWVAKVARELHLPSAFFFIQSAASFSVVYQFFKCDGGVVNSNIDPTGALQIPGLPLLRYGEIPQFLRPTEAVFPVFREHIETLEKHPNPCMIINTFDGLEEESIKSIPDHINIFSVGPLVPGETEEPFICDIFQDSDRETYLRWLDSKPAKSVVYVSFGSIVELGKKQKEEILEGLIEAGHPFLWVIRNHGEDDEVAKSYRACAAAECDGMIVRWCSQVEVLNHFAIGCFVSHCGWNSILESMVGGVAVVGCPQFADQKMNIKMVEEVWGNGVKAVADGEYVVGREEIKRCLEVAMGGEEIKKKCERLKTMAMEAVVDGGPSHSNLKRLMKSLNCIS